MCFSFHRAWIAPHNNIWADVELSSLAGIILEREIQNGRHEINKISIAFSITEIKTKTYNFLAVGISQNTTW